MNTITRPVIWPKKMTTADQIVFYEEDDRYLHSMEAGRMMEILISIQKKPVAGSYRARLEKMISKLEKSMKNGK